MVDTLGLVLGVVVTAASVSDRAGALEVLPAILRVQPRLEVLWADAGYAGGTLPEDLRAHAAHPGLRLEIIKCSDPAPKGFLVQPKRRLVERTFGWLMQARRLARDYETKPTSKSGPDLRSSLQNHAPQTRSLTFFTVSKRHRNHPRIRAGVREGRSQVIHSRNVASAPVGYK